MYDSILIAKYIMFKCNELKRIDSYYEYNNTKIQKLLYILYGFYFAINNLRLTNEQPRLWPYGPVFKNVFEDIQNNGFYIGDALIFKSIPDNDKELMNSFILDFGKFKASVLSKWSHAPDSPWSNTINIFGNDWGVPLIDEDIESYFRGLLTNE